MPSTWQSPSSRSPSPTSGAAFSSDTAHHWDRLLLDLGKEVTLLPPQHVRPFARRTKTDRNDADALIQAVGSGEIPAVAVKTRQQQQMVALHRARAARMKTRTARINLLRGLLAEQGLPVSVGARTGLAQMARLVDDDDSVPLELRVCAEKILEEISDLEERIAALESSSRPWPRARWPSCCRPSPGSAC